MDIKPVKNKPDQNIIDGLQMLMDEAVTGEIAGLSFAIDYANSEVNCGHFGKNSTNLIGETTILVADLVDHWRGHRE